MKTIAIIINILLLGVITQAQTLKESNVPDAVKVKFTSMHPSVKNVKWEREDRMYEAEFEENKVTTSLLFKADGTHVQTEIEIAIASLPQKVSGYVKESLGGKKIEEAAKITDASGKVTYEAEVGGNDYIFDAEGHFLNKESGDDQEDDDE